MDTGPKSPYGTSSESQSGPLITQVFLSDSFNDASYTRRLNPLERWSLLRSYKIPVLAVILSVYPPHVSDYIRHNVEFHECLSISASRSRKPLPILISSPSSALPHKFSTSDSKRLILSSPPISVAIERGGMAPITSSILLLFNWGCAYQTAAVRSKVININVFFMFIVYNVMLVEYVSEWAVCFPST